MSNLVLKLVQLKQLNLLKLLLDLPDVLQRVHGLVRDVLDLYDEGGGGEVELNHMAEDGQLHGGVEMMGWPAGSQD